MYTLSEARYACSSQIGRKAKTLAGLYAKGFRVCEGMILNTDAFCVFCESNGWTLGEDMAGNSPSPADIPSSIACKQPTKRSENIIGS